MLSPVTSSSAQLPAADVAAVLRLTAVATAADGVAPLSEQTLLRLQQPGPGVLHVLVRRDEGLAGYAQLDQRLDIATAEVVVAPSLRRRGVGTALLRGIEAGAPSVGVWAHGDLAGAAALAKQFGYQRSRVLLQLRRSLKEPLPDAHWPAGVHIRTFYAGADEARWLALNNAAFASHPEQGRWSLADLAHRTAQSWFDPAGFFLAESGGELIGFHWTKVHQVADKDGDQPIGEVYVVGVRPQERGRGLGPALTLAGLHHLRDQGLEQVLLYVDESNINAVRTYTGLGFTRFAADVLYTQRA